ncbi:ATP-binding cassette domain-containing protein [Membranicola marinus]|uniref:ATP-binding cassette domain-containing protein n=1 Tax=Membranihabitans marinus TaxID=1227546 RepID=A0A953HTV0_9BACT|nr:ATP-binding cassette domain-containing protein [Membranihabitans marinus]MBY5958325.1 ATP-binding cassette domain-containing protein [Membranihabitans marinus]
MIRCENIFKSFDETEVLKDISIVFESGKNNLIIGKSGAGKTVLLKILVGLLNPTSGKIWYDGHDFTSLNHKELQKLRNEVGMLFQGSALFDSMTVEENIRFPMDMFTKKTKKEKKNRVNYCLERVNLEGINDQFPSEISGGMQKRVGIARSIVMEPNYLFCDEPNSGLDPKTSIVIDELISNITYDDNITTIINTHDMNSVLEIGDNINLLHNGKLAWQGTKSEVLKSQSEELVDFIFASPFLKKLRGQAIDEL